MYSVLEKFSHNIILDEIAHLLENGKIINAVKAVIHERGNCVVRVSFRDQTDYQIDVERGSFEDTWNEACAILMAVTNITEGIDRLTVNQISKLEKGLPVLASVAGGAPMIGFLGTVMGMIQAFYDMSNAGNNIDVTLLSTGIYQAMVTTVAGLIVGIIAYFAYNILVSNVEKVVFKMEATTSEFMDLLYEPV